MKTFKLWLEIEERDHDINEYRDLSAEGEFSPLPAGNFGSLDEAIQRAEFLSAPDPRDEPS